MAGSVPAIALLVVIAIGVCWIIYQISQDAMLLVAIQNMDSSAVVDAFRGMAGMHIAMYVGALLAIVVGGFLVWRQGGLEVAVNESKATMTSVVNEVTDDARKMGSTFQSAARPVMSSEQISEANASGGPPL